MGLPPQPARLPQLAWGSRAGSAGAGGKESASVGLRRSGAQCRREPQVCMTTPHRGGGRKLASGEGARSLRLRPRAARRSRAGMKPLSAVTKERLLLWG
ncbi:hypothetical protein IG611_20015 [Pectobacterium sp. A535-S3-A17]|nr:hypothetical protein [Pectobacterium quasiaquaticum]